MGENSLFEIVPIEGKGLGCVALKDMKIGTLILEEVPKFPPEKKDTNEKFSAFLFGLIDSFDSMSENDQSEFMKLSNQFKDDKEFESLVEEKITNANLENAEELKETLKKAIEILGICKTNCFPSGVLLKTSRFNHSCASNAELIIGGEGEKGNCEIRTVSKIKSGDEITINYHKVETGLIKKAERQEILLEYWGFECHCPVCEEEETSDTKANDEKYDYYENCKKVAEAFCGARNRDKTKMTHENLKKEIFCYKEMYKMAKEKKASRQYLLKHICEEGWQTALCGYETVTGFVKQIKEKAKKGKGKRLLDEEKRQLVTMTKQAEEFQKDCQQFSKIGELLTKQIFGANSASYLQWQERDKMFDKADTEVNQLKALISKLKIEDCCNKPQKNPRMGG